MTMFQYEAETVAGETHHLCQTPRRHDVSRMHEAVEMPCCFLNLLSHIVVHLHIEDIGHEVKRVLVVLDLRVKAGQVEAVRKVVFVDLAEVLISSGRYELIRWLARVMSVPRHPSCLRQRRKSSD